jgi:hypothetical protein
MKSSSFRWTTQGLPNDGEAQPLPGGDATDLRIRIVGEATPARFGFEGNADRAGGHHEAFAFPEKVLVEGPDRAHHPQQNLAPAPQDR